MSEGRRSDATRSFLCVEDDLGNISGRCARQCQECKNIEEREETAALLPAEPTEEMVDAPRMFLAYCETPGRNLKDARKHMERCGDSIESWPEWAKREDGHITKGGLAIIVWHMMKNAAPQGSEGTHRTDPAGPVSDDAHAPAGAAPDSENVPFSVMASSNPADHRAARSTAAAASSESAGYPKSSPVGETPMTDAQYWIDDRDVEVCTAHFARKLEGKLAEALHWKEVYFRANAEARSAPSSIGRSEPTEEMLDAGADAFLQVKQKYGANCPLMLTLREAYKAMAAIDAAPSATAAPSEPPQGVITRMSACSGISFTKARELYDIVATATSSESAEAEADRVFNCPRCGAHDFGLNLPSCPHCGYLKGHYIRPRDISQPKK